MKIIKPALATAALLALAACNNPRTQAGAPNTRISPANTPGSTALTGVPPTGASAPLTLPTAPTPGDPSAPTATRPQGESRATATGGGTPLPTRPGGAGGVGSGGQPSFGGTSTTGR